MGRPIDPLPLSGGGRKYVGESKKILVYPIRSGIFRGGRLHLDPGWLCQHAQGIGPPKKKDQVVLCEECAAALDAGAEIIKEKDHTPSLFGNATQVARRRRSEKAAKAGK